MEARKHLVIPDCQVTSTSPTDHLKWIGQYIVDKQPDVVVQLGDFADMESLSSYDKGKKQYEGRRYIKDIDAAHAAMRILMEPLTEHNLKKIRNKEKQYRPELHLTLGNHENRISRCIEDDPKSDGLMSVDDLNYSAFGWQVHPFLEVLEIDGVAYSHYFYNPLTSRAYGGQSIDTRLKTLGFSFVQGHQQVYMSGSRPLNNGRRIRGLIAGNCYLHDEDYRGPQANAEMRAVFMLHEVRRGDYLLMEVSLDYLCRKYEGVPLWKFMKENYPNIFEALTWMKLAA